MSGGSPDLLLRLRLEHESGAARRSAAEGALKYGGSGTSFAELARRGDYQVELGRARLAYPHEPSNLLQRLGISAPLAAHCSRVRARYTIKAQ